MITMKIGEEQHIHLLKRLSMNIQLAISELGVKWVYSESLTSQTGQPGILNISIVTVFLHLNQFTT